MLEVKLASSLREFVGGAATIAVDATTIRELMRKLVERYPRLQSKLDGIAVSIDGEIFRDEWSRKIPDGAEVFLLPRIQGG